MTRLETLVSFLERNGIYKSSQANFYGYKYKNEILNFIKIHEYRDAKLKSIIKIVIYNLIYEYVWYDHVFQLKPSSTVLYASHLDNINYEPLQNYINYAKKIYDKAILNDKKIAIEQNMNDIEKDFV